MWHVQVFRKAKLVAYIGGSVSIVLFIVIIPGVMISLRVLSEVQFHGWVTALQVCGCVCVCVCVCV